MQVDRAKPPNSQPTSLLDMDFPIQPTLIERHSAPIPLNHKQSPNEQRPPPINWSSIQREEDEIEKRANSWFQEAGPGSDGILDPAKARDFFARTGIPRTQLSQVNVRLETLNLLQPRWNMLRLNFWTFWILIIRHMPYCMPPLCHHSKFLFGLQIWNFAKRDASSGSKGLTLTQFIVALRLVALAQTGKELTERLMLQASTAKKWSLANNFPLPPPRIDDPRDQLRWFIFTLQYSARLLTPPLSCPLLEVCMCSITTTEVQMVWLKYHALMLPTSNLLFVSDISGFDL